MRRDHSQAFFRESSGAIELPVSAQPESMLCLAGIGARRKCKSMAYFFRFIHSRIAIIFGASLSFWSDHSRTPQLPHFV